jgi:hypothetical protein
MQTTVYFTTLLDVMQTCFSGHYAWFVLSIGGIHALIILIYTTGMPLLQDGAIPMLYDSRHGHWLLFPISLEPVSLIPGLRVSNISLPFNTVAFMVQLFYAWRIMVLGQHKLPFQLWAGLLALIALTGFVASWYAGIKVTFSGYTMLPMANVNLVRDRR